MRSLRLAIFVFALVVTATSPTANAADSLECQAVPVVDDRCEIWVGTYDHPAGHGSTGLGFDYAQTMAVGKTSVFVTGTSWDETERTQSIATVAFSQADGTERWVARTGTGAISHAYGIASSPDDEMVYVTGAVDYDFYTAGDLVTVAYDAETGVERWSAMTAGAGLATGLAVAVGLDGTVFVTGRADDDVITLAYEGSTGTELWRTYLRSPAGGEDQGRQIAVASDGSAVFVAGFVSAGPQGTDWDYLVVAYRAQDDPSTMQDERGRELWSATYGSSGELDVALGLDVSPDDSRVFVTGQSGAAGRGVRQNIDYATLAVDAATGDRLWERRYAGPLRGENIAMDLDVAPDGDRVYVTGQGTGEGTDLDWEVTTVAYDAATGEDDWTRRYGFPGPCLEWGQSLVATADAVYVSGVSSANCFQIDLVTLRLDAANGTAEWVARFNHSGISNDFPAAVGLSADGSRVFVAGQFSEKGLDPGSDNLDDYGLVAYAA